MASFIAVICYWVIGVPLAAIFAFKCDFRVTGLLSGLLAAIGLQMLSYLILVLRSNW